MDSNGKLTRCTKSKFRRQHPDEFCQGELGHKGGHVFASDEAAAVRCGKGTPPCTHSARHRGVCNGASLTWPPAKAAA